MRGNWTQTQTQREDGHMKMEAEVGIVLPEAR